MFFDKEYKLFFCRARSGLRALPSGLLFIWMCLSSLNLQARPNPQQPQNPDPIIIEAKADPDDQASGKTGASTIIDLSAETAGHRSMGEILEREASVHVNRYGGRGAYNTLSVRGSNANQSNLYINGIPITNAVNGEVNLSDWNPDGFKSIEIYRSGDYAAASVGGSVNMVTHKGGEDCQHLRLKGMVGSYKTAGAGVDACGGEEFYYSIQARGEVSDQDYLFHNENGTPLINRFDDFEDVRDNAWYREIFNTMHLGTQLGNTELGLLVDSAYRNHGVPGPAPRQTQKTERHLLRHTLGLTTDSKGLLWEQFRLASRLYYSEARTKFFDPRQEFSSNQPNSQSQLQKYGLILEPTIYLLDWYQTLRFYMTLGRESYRQDRRDKVDRYLETLPVRFRNQTILRLTDEIAFWGERIVFTPSGEYQRIHDRFNDPDQYINIASILNGDHKRPAVEISNYRLGLKLIAYQSKPLQFYFLGSAATGSRAPLFIELFGDRGSIVGNPDLSPENSETIEGGGLVSNFNGKT